MPIPFATIPEHIRKSIAQMHDLRSFAKLEGCSRSSYEFAPTVKRELIIDLSINNPSLLVNYRQGEFEVRAYFLGDGMLTLPSERTFRFPIQIVCREIRSFEPLGTELCKCLTDFFLVNKSTANYLRVDGIQCSPEAFNNFLEISRLTELTIYGPVSRDRLIVPSFKNLEKLHASGYPLNDDQLLTLKMPSLGLFGTQITELGINSLLKEWLTGERDISYIRIGLKAPVGRNIFKGISYSVGTQTPNEDVYFVEKKNASKIRITIHSYPFFYLVKLTL